jgi:hypothetical protein
LVVDVSEVKLPGEAKHNLPHEYGQLIDGGDTNIQNWIRHNNEVKEYTDRGRKTSFSDYASI